MSAAPKNETLDWLLGLAVDFEFQENKEKFAQQKEGSENMESAAKNNPLDNLDCELKLLTFIYSYLFHF